MRGTASGHRVADIVCDGAARDPAGKAVSHTGRPFSCIVAHPSLPSPSAAAAPPAFFSGKLPPPLGTPVGTPSSPCWAPSGCGCAPSPGSSAPSPGACRVHERVFTCPPPPPPVTSGDTDLETVKSVAGGDGELAVPSNDDQEVWHPRDDTSEEVKEESVKELLLRLKTEPSKMHNTHPFGSLQKQVSIMSLNLGAKIDEIQCHQHADTNAALHAIRAQLQDLTKSVESCQSEVVEVKRDMQAIKHEIDTLQAAKEEIEELRDAVDRLEEHHRRRKLRLLEQVKSS